MKNTIIFLILLLCSCKQNIPSKNHYSKANTEILDISDPRLIYPNSENTLRWFDVEHNPDSAFLFSLTTVSDRRENRRWVCTLPENLHSSISLLEGSTQQRNNEIQEWYSNVRSTYAALYNEVDTSGSIQHTELIAVLFAELQLLAKCPATKKVLVCHSDALQHMGTGTSINDELSNALQKSPLPQACGVNLIFVYKAISLVDDQAFNKAVEVYRKVLSRYGITVQTQAQNEILLME